MYVRYNTVSEDHACRRVCQCSKGGSSMFLISCTHGLSHELGVVTLNTVLFSEFLNSSSCYLEALAISPQLLAFIFTSSMILQKAQVSELSILFMLAYMFRVPSLCKHFFFKLKYN